MRECSECNFVASGQVCHHLPQDLLREVYGADEGVKHSSTSGRVPSATSPEYSEIATVLLFPS